MTTMVEKIARAMYESRPGEWTGDTANWDAEYPDTKEALRVLARAALSAMLEPSEAMSMAVWARTHQASGDPLPQPDERDGEGWVPGALRAAIQAALDEKP